MVMRATQSKNEVTCEVLGPTPPKVVLSLKLGNQSIKVSDQRKLVTVLDPEAGMWRCLLRDKDKVLLESQVEVLPTAFTRAWPELLASVIGGIIGLLFLAGFCIVCVKCWHRRRRAERMSQIKRLLSEKKTCQCAHRQQKNYSLT